ncbi:active breakpoint cluster region-related protein isoform X3, partial [Tachysurus ichikawai]
MEEGEEEVLGFLDKVLEDEDVFEYEVNVDLDTPCTLSEFKVRNKREEKRRMNESFLSLCCCSLLTGSALAVVFTD